MLLDDINNRKPNLFEKILLIIGIIGIAVGYWFLHNVIISKGLFSYETTVCLLLWFALIILIIHISVAENAKEELKIIIKQQHDEMKLLRQDLRRKR